MQGKVCLVTGATRGIGRASAQALAALGATVLVHGRDLAGAQAVAAHISRATGNREVRPVHADLAALAAVRRLAAELAAQLPRLHVLINNAAVLTSAGAVSADGYELTFAVNHLAPFLLTNLLLPRLRQSAPARVIVVASEAHRRATLDFDDLMSARTTGSWTAYERSKLANVLFMRALDRRLAGSGVTVNAVHPGVVRSGLFRHSPVLLRAALAGFGWLLLSPRRGARGSVYLASAPELSAASGGYFRRCRQVAPGAAAQSAASAERLWQESARLAGLGCP
jgi:NAD(P)-dependent dehydrogenase (short-subunit alcohol dehydrogenase family)